MPHSGDLVVSGVRECPRRGLDLRLAAVHHEQLRRIREAGAASGGGDGAVARCGSRFGLVLLLGPVEVGQPAA